MDPQLGDILNASVHVNDGAIVAVGANVSAPGATAIDAVDEGFATRVLMGLCAGVAPDTTGAAVAAMQAAGVSLA